MLAPPQRLTNQTDNRSETSFYTLTSHRTCPVLPLSPASRWHAGNPVPTLTMLTTCPDIFRSVLPNTLCTLSRSSRLYTTSLHDIATPPILIDVAKITGHQCVRGRGDAIAVLYETQWDDLLPPTWERKFALRAFRRPILSYCAIEPAQHQPHTRKYQQQRINETSREIARSKGERHLPGSYRLLTDDVYRARFLSAPLPIGVSIWYHSFHGSWWLGKVKQPPNDSGRYVIQFLHNPGPALIKLQESTCNTALHAPCGSWCLQTHGRSNPLQGVLHG